MRALTIADMENILQEAIEFDEDIDRAWVYFAEDDQYQPFCQFFERDNFSHFDSFSDEWIEIDNADCAKRLKKILRGKDIPELIKFALDFGRLVGRAEYTLKHAD